MNRNLYIKYHARKFRRACWAKFVFIRKWIKNGFTPTGTIAFFPEQPPINSIIYLIYHFVGLKKIKNISRAELKIYWENSTYSEPVTISSINKDVTNISKSEVEFFFKKVFGYGSFIYDNKKLEKVVQKSEENALHDGIVLNELPVAELQIEEYCYQRLIHNQPNAQVVEDLRVPIIDGIIPFVYRKIRPVSLRFENKNKEVTIHSPNAIFTSKELQLIVCFVNEFKLNYGELDILRDYISGRIYIIDVNKTPWGPPNGLNKYDQNKSVQILSELFFSRFYKK